MDIKIGVPPSLDGVSPEIKAQTDAAELQRAASQVSEVIKEELKHSHYFHAPGKRMNHPTFRWWLHAICLTLLVAGLSIILGRKASLIIDIVSIFLIGLGLGLSIADIMYWRTNLSRDRLNPDKVLKVDPVLLDSDPKRLPLDSIPFHRPDWLANVKAMRPENEAHYRIALGQLRRRFLRTYEDVGMLVAKAKQADSRNEPLLQRLFWLSAIFSIATVILTLIMSSTDSNFPSISVEFAFASLSMVAFSSSIMLIDRILCVDLVRVKFLRASHGFITAAEPFNRVVANILNDTRGQRRKEIQISSFEVARDTLEIQVSGEAQRLQIKQFWVAGMVSSLGAIIAAWAIVHADINASQSGSDRKDNESWREFVCQVTPPNDDGIVTQTCVQEYRQD